MALPLSELFDILMTFAVRSGRRKLKGNIDDNNSEEFWHLMESR